MMSNPVISPFMRLYRAHQKPKRQQDWLVVTYHQIDICYFRPEALVQQIKFVDFSWLV